MNHDLFITSVPKNFFAFSLIPRLSLTPFSLEGKELIRRKNHKDVFISSCWWRILSKKE